MRMAELAAQAEVTVPTIKFYLREGLLPEGVRTGPTQAEYDDAHVKRLRVIRSLLDAGVTLAAARHVLDAIDDPPPPFEMLGVAHSAVIAPVSGALDVAEASELAERVGWQPGLCDDAVLDQLARALATLDRAGFTPPPGVLDAYVSAARSMAEAEIADIPSDSRESAVRYVVLGTVLVEPLILALRRVAEQVVSFERFADAAGDEGAAPH